MWVIYIYIYIYIYISKKNIVIVMVTWLIRSWSIKIKNNSSYVVNHQVMGVPTVVILKNGEIKERFVGVQSKEVIKDKILAIS